ncbi:FG-GAP-like repeat-containing protein [Streptomyces anandii]
MRELPRTGTQQFSLLGVSWTGAAKKLDGTAQVRTRGSGTGRWSDWRNLELDVDPLERVTPRMRGASEPLWVGPSDGVEVRVVAEDGGAAAGLPKGLQVNLVDPGVVTNAETRSLGSEVEPAAFAADGAVGATDPATASTGTADASPGDTTTASPGATDAATAPATDPAGTATAADTASPADSTSPGDQTSATGSPSASPSASKPVAPPSTVTRPPVISRAQWGADESKVDDAASYIDRIQAVFVHHSAGSNSYSCAESASLVRGIMAYHIDVNGWNDLGYNFLVDKCGQIFEGRAGGIDLPVLGAHTYGFNSYSTGIAVLGDFQGDASKGIPAARPTRATLESVARIAAWKLGQYGGDPAGTVTLTAMEDTGVWKKGQQATLSTVSGHRDAFATECPGTNLYGNLGEIRRFAKSAGANSAIPSADFNRDGVTDLVAGVPRASSGTVVVVPGSTDGPVGASRVNLTQSSPGVPGSSESGDSFGAATAWGDVNGDGYADLAIGSPGEDDTSGHANRGSVTLLYGPGLNSGYQYATSGVTATGAGLGSAVTVGDFDADGKADVFAAGTGNGGSWNARLTGGATQYGTLTSATGPVAYTDAATGDFNRDGYADVALNYRDQSGVGRVTWFKGGRTGLTKVSVLSVKGGRSIAAGDVNGNGYDDLVIGQPYVSESGAYRGGQVTMVPGTSTGFTTTGMRTVHQDTGGVPGAAEDGDGMGSSVSVGDLDADGYADVLTGVPNEDMTRSGVGQTNAGMAVLLKGTSSGPTGTGAQVFSQDTSGISGWTEKDDKFGSAVVLQDLSGWGRADLAIGAEGENSYDGTVLQLDTGSSGVDTGTGVYYGLGTPAAAHLGQTLTP